VSRSCKFGVTASWKWSSCIKLRLPDLFALTRFRVQRWNILSSSCRLWLWFLRGFVTVLWSVPCVMEYPLRYGVSLALWSVPCVMECPLRYGVSLALRSVPCVMECPLRYGVSLALRSVPLYEANLYTEGHARQYPKTLNGVRLNLVAVCAI
jgi:hypothetical protein